MSWNDTAVEGQNGRLSATSCDSIGEAGIPTFTLTAGEAGRLSAPIAAWDALPASWDLAETLRAFEVYEEEQCAER